jgi:opacity protein-like surface antigen
MKNLKKIFILFSIFLSFFTNAQSDKGFYTSLNCGYNLGTGNPDYYQSAVLGIVNTNQITSTTSTTEILKLPLGKGINVGANFGYMFNKNLGFEVGVNYLLGGTTTANQTNYNGDYGNSEVSAKMIQIKPSIVFRAGFDKINPYAKVGMVIGSGKITNTQIEKNLANLYVDTREFSGGTPIGFHSGLGLLFKLNEKLSLFGELNLVSLEYAPNKAIFTESTKNGIDQLPTKTNQQKETEFLESFTDTGAPSNPNEPSKSPKLPFSFNSFGVNIGLQYHF